MENRPRILVVDSDPDHTGLLSQCLRAVGTVDSAASGEEGLTLLRAADPHLVIADHRLPGLSGLEVLKAAGERDPHVGRILLTHFGDTQAAIDAAEGDRVDAFLSKPCLAHQLRMTARSVLGRCQLERDNVELVRRLTQKNGELREALDSLRSAQRRVVDAERLGAIGRMIAMIVHDFRSPLTVMRVGVDEIRRGEVLEGELPTLARELDEEVERMCRMCSNLLHVSRASGGAISQTKEPLDEIVESAAHALAREAEPAGVVIQARFEARLEMLIDADRLRSALMNLGHNAIDAMPGGGTLSIETACEAGGATISVRDSGRGIPEAIAARVFDPFVTSGKSGGSGLGLAVVKKVIEDHGGRVELESPSEGGTLFRLHLPAKLVLQS